MRPAWATYIHTQRDCSVGCWSQQERIAQRAAALQTSCDLQTTPVFPCSNQLLPYPRLSTAAGLCPSISTCLCRDMCQCVTLAEVCCKGVWDTKCSDLYPICAGEHRERKVANCTICSVPIGAPPQSPGPYSSQMSFLWHH